MKKIELIAIVLSAASLACGATPWTQFHGSAAHEGRWDGQVSVDAVSQQWTAGQKLCRSSQPIVSADGSLVFAYSESGNLGGTLYAFDSQTGQQTWSTGVKAYTGMWSWSSPIYDNGYLYWTGGNKTFTTYKINAVTGNVEWTSDFTGSIVNASPTLAGDNLYISTYGGYSETASHYAINLTDGSLAWSADDGGAGQGAMAYDADRNRVYQTILESGSYKLRAYDAATGQRAWTADWSLDYRDSQCAIACDGGKIYFQDYDFYGSGNLYVADADTGNLLWSAPTPASGDSSPAVAPDGSVFAYGDYNGTGQTRAYNPDGSIRWTFTEAGGWEGCPAWADGYVFAGTQNANTFYLLDDQTGEVIKSLTGSGPASFGRDAFYTVGVDGVLYAYSLTDPNLSRIPGDANGDGTVDVGDLGILAGNYGTAGGAEWATGDFNGDGKVDVGDLGILAGNYGFTGQTGAVTVPELISVVYIGLSGLFGAVLKRERWC